MTIVKSLGVLISSLLEKDVSLPIKRMRTHLHAMASSFQLFEIIFLFTGFLFIVAFVFRFVLKANLDRQQTVFKKQNGETEKEH